MCFIWPRKILQTLILPFEQFLLNSPQLRQPVLWNVSCQSSTDLELFSPCERDRPLGTSLRSSHWALADGAQWLLLEHMRCSSPGAGFSILALILGTAWLCITLPRSPSIYLPGSLLYLLLEVLCPVFSIEKSEVEGGGIPQAAGWTALLCFISFML